MRLLSRISILVLIGLMSISPFAEAIANPNAPDKQGGSGLTPEQVLQYQPNELGVIPIFMYHNIMDDPESGVDDVNAHLYRSVDELYGDLQWLYDRNFHLSGMLPLIEGRIDVPLGKHPVVLTFDDSSSMHLSFQIGADGNPIKDENGEYVPTADCAVGIIERFAKDHPDFGKTAHFGVIPAFKFSWPEYEQDDLFQAKLQWLLDHGYEIGNHTSDHNDLAAASLSDFARMIAEPNIWISELVDPNSPGYALNVITLPFGAYPDGGWTGDKGDYITNGYVWDGYPIEISAMMLVCCGPAPSPFSNEYAPRWIPRIRGDDPDFARFGNEIDTGAYILYTSDGDPSTLMVPWPLPPSQVGDVNWDAVDAHGVTVVKYDPDTGQITPHRRR